MAWRHKLHGRLATLQLLGPQLPNECNTTRVDSETKTPHGFVSRENRCWSGVFRQAENAYSTVYQVNTPDIEGSELFICRLWYLKTVTYIKYAVGIFVTSMWVYMCRENVLIQCLNELPIRWDMAWSEWCMGLWEYA